MLKRINNEMKELTIKYPNVSINSNNDIITIDNKKFILDKSYPFVKPTVYINGILYYKYLNTPIRIQQILNKKKYRCMCCETILCSWNPSNTINTILLEIKNYNKIKEEIKYILLVEEILKKYNNYISKDYIISYLI